MYRMGRLYQMGLLLFPLMDFFFIYIEKVTGDICNLFKDINRFYIYQSMLFDSQAFYLSLGMPCNNPDKQKFQSGLP